MPPRDSTLRLHDIIEAISRILRYTAQHSLDTFAADEMAVDAVVRNLEVIGEAARHVDETTMERLRDVPWWEMRDLRTHSVQPLRTTCRPHPDDSDGRAGRPESSDQR